MNKYRHVVSPIICSYLSWLIGSYEDHFLVSTSGYEAMLLFAATDRLLFNFRVKICTKHKKQVLNVRNDGEKLMQKITQASQTEAE